MKVVLREELRQAMTKCSNSRMKGLDVRALWIGSVLLSTALCSQAVTLGRHSGAAIIGRSLDIRVQLLGEPGEDLAAQCIQSEVLYGDSLVSSSVVSTAVQRSAPDAQASIRILANRPVDEPIVTVNVRVGCTAPFSRRFVLLADFVSEPASPAAGTGVSTSALTNLPTVGAGESALAPAAPAAGSIALQAARDLSAAQESRAPDRGAGLEAAAAAPTRSAEPRRAAQSVVRRPAPAEPSVPRLQLDPVDLSLSIDRDPVLKISLAMLSEPTSSDEERAAAAALWKAINASPEDILRDGQKLSVLEAEAKGLREQEARNRAALQDMESRLESSRYITWLAYLLGALLLLALLGIALVMRRKNERERAAPEKAWWAGAEKADKAKEKPSRKAVVSTKAALAARQEPTGVDLDLDLASDSSFDDYQSLSGPLVDDSLSALLTKTPDNAPSLPNPARSVATEELFDVQQQADFFVSLGETDKAIGVLKDHLSDNQEPSPLAYLDLLKLYHQLGHEADYNALREDFNRTFNASAPPFEQYTDDSRGLDSYETAFGRIQALWPQPRVLDVIEQSIFKEANDPDGEVFGLEAYRELLLLHSIAKEMVKREQGDAGDLVDFQHTAIKPLKAAAHSGVAAAVAAAAAAVSATEERLTQPNIEEMPMASPRLGLDVDLDALSEISAFEASLPEVAAPVEPTAKPMPPPGKTSEQQGNLIDFEVLDFMPPEIDGEPAKPDGDKPV